MRYLDIFSGISAPTVAWSSLGWQAIGFGEIDGFCSAVLCHHYPNIPNYGDVCNFDWSTLRGQVDVVVGGSPCQSFSEAGQHNSLNDPRGQLCLRYIDVVNSVASPFCVWENVPGILRTKDNAFGQFLAQLVGETTPLAIPDKKWPNAGFCIGPKRSAAWRIMDAVGWGLPQRRKRIFVVACDFRNITRLLPQVSRKNRVRFSGIPAAILFECQSSQGDNQSRHQTRQKVTTSPRSGFTFDSEPVAFTCKDYGQDVGYVSPTLRAMGFTNSHANGGGQVAVVYNVTFDDSNGLRKDRPNGGCYISEAQTSTTLTTGINSVTNIVENLQVRRLTPTECLRLQGFPDNYLDINYQNKPATNSKKYHAIGNSMAVPVVRWIGERIEQVLTKLQEEL